MNVIRKAILPVAGFGTRFLPATKTIPKEMLTIVDRPVVEYIVEEARAAGIEHLIFVTGRSKGLIEDHFDRHPELEDVLATARNGGETDHAFHDNLAPAGSVSFTRQQMALGLGHAIWCARELVSNEPFAVVLPDMLHKPRTDGCMTQLVKAYRPGGNYVGIFEVPEQDVTRYGIVAPDDGSSESSFRIAQMVEKPTREQAPSRLALSGRYILQPEILNVLAEAQTAEAGEIRLTDAMRTLSRFQPFFGVRFDGDVFDCGSKLGFLAANVSYALERCDVGDEFRSEIEYIILGSLPDQVRVSVLHLINA
ncbi:UTP--glucose-1-phosphate uridylyltransferase [Xanthobacteraceae bacterium Astr-EGSB]|uniref:UTP--glucose-1-phosphate uridylyltransferase n=1 Tax=Astrobacterium formosum TaxID=3069710 RepID=UPI0027B58C35|nr:UTP--glucose-1-phosphate uridylyltransferase [Xanthobacteraceae bacterium Astr-EGSB]